MKTTIKIMCAILALVCMSTCFVGCVSKKEKAKIAETIAAAEAASVENIAQYVNSLEAKHFKKSDSQTNYVMLEIEGFGDIVVALRPDTAPISVDNFKKLVSEGFYNGLIFHRIIKNFMIQGGGYTSAFGKTSAPTIKGEFNSNGVENKLLHLRGVLSMARTSVPDSATSQFFIMHVDYPSLDGEYAAFGYVIAGLDVVDKIANVRTGINYQMYATDWPLETVMIKSAYFVSPIVE